MIPFSSNIFRSAFLADALSLGSHWIYNQGKVARLYPEGVRDFDDPRSNYHPNRKKGQFTHYGDQMVMVAQAVVATPQWSLPVFHALWQAGMSDYDGYVDGATKGTLENMAAGAEKPASDSNDLAGASRFVPALFAGKGSLEDRIQAAREQTALTHGDGSVVDSAEFFVRAVTALQEGADLPAALEKAAASDYADLPAREWLQKARGALSSEDPSQVAADFGLTCHIPEAFPATLYFALRWHQQGADPSAEGFLASLSENILAGGDNSARAIPQALLLTAAGCEIPLDLWNRLEAHETLSALEQLILAPKTSARKVTFTGANGDSLDARLELPGEQPRGYALFAHCFTCGKSSRAATAISRALAARGIATLRFDFTGLGQSEGDFANTSFLSNVEDLVAAANHLREHFMAPALLIGHSLGGAAVLAAAGEVPECTHVATIGAPFDPGHVTHLFEMDLSEIESKGEAEVTLAGRNFRIGSRFLTDLEGHDQEQRIARLGRRLLVMHSPMDEIVGLENAGEIYSAAKHPKSFLSLDRADHLLTDAEEARQAAQFIASWVRL
ncbi:alpha/beta fold hydrolase [Roseibacillus ishigakijimensis]|uniref:Alpha/beta fold hydrolase n=1 Tax=Roseibacillus ishigakijimensis TaxID=454146 RepID=A0A934RM62_9BACT|nr:alpha/beta fold hydrolase [Roseibacillus ishigakijimensis]MBK1833378.1 alpha/beta fold hydrolase [Roseibacillus ishigakijimensis]